MIRLMRLPLGHLRMGKFIFLVTNINMCSIKMVPMKGHVSYSVIGVKPIITMMQNVGMH